MIAGAAYAPETLLTSLSVKGVGRARIRLRAEYHTDKILLDNRNPERWRTEVEHLRSTINVDSIAYIRHYKQGIYTYVYIEAVKCCNTVQLTHLKLCSPPPVTEGNAMFTITG